MTSISITIITKNESENIRGCLESVKWADEIIVLDSGSTDNTCDIARCYTKKVFVADWQGYGKQKNLAISYATKDWILSLDADEKISDTLAQEIKHAIQTGKYDGYCIPIKLVFLGKLIRFASSKDYTLRLFKRSKGKFSEKLVHENLNLSGNVGVLRNPMLHYSVNDLTKWLKKLNDYTSLDATQKIQNGVKSSLMKAVFKSAWMFLRVYIFQGGLLDGKHGLMLAIFFAQGAFYRYAKIAFPDKP